MARYQGSLKPPFTFSDFRGADGHFDINAELEAERQWLEKVKADLRSKSKGDLVGEEVNFPRGDGYARYLIAKQRPFTLVHLELGDAWHADGATIRGYRLQDARARVEANRRWEQQRKEAELAYEKLLDESKVLHYDNGFGDFIRCEVVEADGKKCLKQVALVGNWKPWALKADSYQMQQIRDGKLMRPNIDNIYEHSKRLQKQHPDPRKLEPLKPRGQMDLFAS